MKREVNDLLSVDRLVRKLGIGGLNPKLRNALEIEARFPARSAGAERAVEGTDFETSEKVVFLDDARFAKNASERDAS